MIKSLEKSQAHHARRNINYKFGGKHRQKYTNTGTRGSEWPLSTKILHRARSLWVSQKCLTQGSAPGSR